MQELLQAVNESVMEEQCTESRHAPNNGISKIGCRCVDFATLAFCLSPEPTIIIDTKYFILWGERNAMHFSRARPALKNETGSLTLRTASRVSASLRVMLINGQARR